MIQEYIGLIFAVIVVAAVIIFQIRSFLKTKGKIKELDSLFEDVDTLSLKETSITPSVLRNKESLQKFLQSIPPRHNDENGDESKDYTDLSLIVFQDGSKSSNKKFKMIINRTNEYLCKNTGTSADLGVLEDICDSQKETLEDEIQNSLNVPLYLGLAGTFIGIITGLLGVDFDQIFGNTNNLNGLQHLLYGIVVAMCASLLGLGFTVYNSAVTYKTAVSKCDDGKGDYMNFLRRELMPLLSNSMASSLNSLKGVLGHFVDKFGRNLDAYADSAELLNDNLEKQHLVLAEINKLSLTQTANKIAETFMQLKDSADSLTVFRTYQEQLNSTIANTSGVINQIQTLIGKFENFSTGLSVVISNQNKTTELQREFQEAITTHFPTGAEAREIWRKEFDLLMSEGKHVSESLSAQLTASTEHIQNFVTNNKEFFDTFDKLKEVLDIMIQYTQVQAECYKDMKGEILNLRTDFHNAQLEDIELNKSILKAIETMTESIKKLKRRRVIMSKNRSNTFWLSYSDLMTSLFFIMLVLFIVCVVKMKGINTQLDKEVNAKEEQLRKIEELNNSIKEIDNKYFEYDEQFKRHTLKDIEVSFNTYSSNINDIGQEQLDKLLKAGQAIVRFMNSAKNKIPEAQYILIVEGQSSKDYYTRNYELSYERALALIKFWSNNGIEFDTLGNCEVLISGSGQSSKFRVQPDVRGNKDNQRFVIHIIPKPGIIE